MCERHIFKATLIIIIFSNILIKRVISHTHAHYFFYYFLFSYYNSEGRYLCLLVSDL